MMKLTLIAVGFAVVILGTIILSVITANNKKLNKNAEIIRELLPGLNCGK